MKPRIFRLSWPFILLAALTANVHADGPPVGSQEPLFSLQWHLQNQGPSEDQTVSLKRDETHTDTQYGVKGADIGWVSAQAEIAKRATSPVTLAVIDFGADMAHEDLQGRVLTTGKDFVTNSASMTDDNGHGTAVSGVIAADGKNQKGIAGVAPNSIRVLPLRVLTGRPGFSYPVRDESYPDGLKYYADFAAEAIDEAVKQGASVINMSFSWPASQETEAAHQAVARAVSHGVLIVVAAGNNRKDETPFPCNYPGVLCVGSVSNNGELAHDSNRGGEVDLLAPGDAILTTYAHLFPTGTLLPGYKKLSGTSMAAPIVSAVAAILRSVYPTIGLNELKARLFASARPSPKNRTLYGMVQIPGALAAKPQPVFLPNFKSSSEVEVDESRLASTGKVTASGTVEIQSLWATASPHVRVRVNDQVVSEATGRLTLPWQYELALDDSSSLRLSVEVDAPGYPLHTFNRRLTAVRKAESIAQDQVTLSPPDGLNVQWLDPSYLHATSRLVPVDFYAQPNAPTQYYQVIGVGPGGASILLMDTSKPGATRRANIPAIQSVRQVIRLDSSTWLVTGVFTASQGGTFFQFYFMNDSLQPLWPTGSAWQILINPNQQDNVDRNWAVPGSWIANDQPSGPRLLPCFIANGRLDPADDYPVDQDWKRAKAENHLYYLVPGPATGANPAMPQVRALDSAPFRDKLDSFHILNRLIPAASQARAGQSQLLVTVGHGQHTAVHLWRIDSLAKTEIVDASGWNAPLAEGTAFSAGPGDTSALVNFYQPAYPTSGGLSWVDGNGKYVGKSEFDHSAVEDQFFGVIGVLAPPGAGRTWFLMSNFDLVAYQDQGSKTAMKTLSNGRDSTLSVPFFNSLFKPVLVSSRNQTLAGVYRDLTSIRGSHVAVDVWDRARSAFYAPLRYSVKIPQGCAAGPGPARTTQDTTSFAVPILCQAGTGAELSFVRP